MECMMIIHITLMGEKNVQVDPLFDFNTIYNTVSMLVFDSSSHLSETHHKLCTWSINAAGGPYNT